MKKVYEDFEVLLRGTDFYYMRSDDPRKYDRGLAEMERAIDVRLSLPDQELADEIWNKYSPHSRK